MGQYHILDVDGFTKKNKLQRIERLKIIREEEEDSFLVESCVGKHSYNFQIYNQMQDGILRSGSGAEPVYVFMS